MSGPTCAACGRSVPVVNLGFPLALEDDAPADVAVRGVPPPPRPLAPVLLSTSHDPGAELGPGLFDRCRQCQARVLPSDLRCPTCGADREEAATPDEARAGPLRRDMEPHRGPLLSWLGRAALFLSFPAWLSVAAWVFTLAGVIAVAMGGTVVVWAREDLAKMRQGTMDPEGQPATHSALGMATGGLVVALLGLLIFLLSRLPLLLGDGL